MINQRWNNKDYHHSNSSYDKLNYAYDVFLWLYGSSYEELTKYTYDFKQYFYHGDHLGSSAWISDIDGEAYQHLQYLPYGEQFIEQRQGTWDTRYKFTSHERNNEIKPIGADSPNTTEVNYEMRQTGLDYAHARYYNSELSIFLSVDPLSDKYPSTSPFAYVENNPIMFTDPTGMFKDEYKLKKSGEFEFIRETDDDFDVLYNEEMTVGTKVEKNVISSRHQRSYTTKRHGKKDYENIEIDDHQAGSDLFEFVATYSDVEWGITKYYDENGCEKSLLTTGNDSGAEFGQMALWYHFDNEGLYTIVSIEHSHPSDNWMPSGASHPNNADGTRHRSADVLTAYIYEQCYPTSITFRIYHPNSNSYFKYDGNTQLSIMPKTSFEISPKE